MSNSNNNSKKIHLSASYSSNSSQFGSKSKNNRNGKNHSTELNETFSESTASIPEVEARPVWNRFHEATKLNNSNGQLQSLRQLSSISNSFDELQRISNHQAQVLLGVLETSKIFCKKVEITDFEIDKTKSEKGGQGIVYSAIRKTDRMDVALKFNKKDTLKAWNREINLMSWLNHPNVIQCIGGGINDNQHFGVFELMDGNLRSFLKANKNRFENGEHVAIHLAYQICNAIQFLHRHHISHRDIKPENILYKKNGMDISIKLADFGSTSIESTSSSDIRDAAFTFLYCSPEFFNKPEGQMDDFKNDIWALGIVLWEIFSTDEFKSKYNANNHPLDDFERKNKIQNEWKAKIEQISKGSDLLGLDSVTNQQMKIILDGCLSIDPNSRPNAAQLFCEIALVYLNSFALVLEIETPIESTSVLLQNFGQACLDLLEIATYLSLPREQMKAFHLLLQLYQTVGMPIEPSSVEFFGSLLEDKGEPERASEIYLNLLTINLTDDDRSSCLNNLGSLFIPQDIDQALKYFNESLELRKTCLGVNHPDYADSLQNVAIAHAYNRNFQRFLEYSNKAIAIYQREFGERSYHVGECYLSFASSPLDPKQRFEYLNMAEEIFLKELGTRNRQMGNLQLSRAEAFQSMGDKTNAEIYFRKSMTIFVACEYVKDCQSIAMHLQDLYSQQDELDDFSRVHEYLEEIFDSAMFNHRKFDEIKARISFFFGTTLLGHGKFEEGREKLFRCLKYTQSLVQSTQIWNYIANSIKDENLDQIRYALIPPALLEALNKLMDGLEKIKNIQPTSPIFLEIKTDWSSVMEILPKKYKSRFIKLIN